MAIGVRLRADDVEVESESESVFMGWILDLAVANGWKIMHSYDSYVPEGSGFPNLVLMKEGRLIFAELKRSTGHIIHAENGWFSGLELVAAANPMVEVYMWKPKDKPVIEGLLTGRAA